MISGKADRGRRGGHRHSVAERATGLAWIGLLGGALLAANSSAAQDAQSGGVVRTQQQMEQALRALARGLSERAEELGQERGQELKDELNRAGMDALATGSIQAPFSRSWIAPVPLPQMSRFEAPSGRPAGRDLTRLFQPDPLGAPAALKRIWPGIRQGASEPTGLPAAPASRSPPAPAASRSGQDLAALPEPRLPLPAPPLPLGLATRPPAAPAELPPAPPVERQAAVAAPKVETPSAAVPAGPQTDPSAQPSARRSDDERGRGTIGAKEPDATPAGRASSPGRIAARPAERPDRQAQTPETDKANPNRRAKPPARLAARPAETLDPDDEPDAGERGAKPARRLQPERAQPAARSRPVASKATRDMARAPALVSPDVTSSLDRSSPSRLQPRASTARLTPNARREVSDIPIIPLPDVLRPTRPPAGSPL
jgi:hypothetical protein